MQAHVDLCTFLCDAGRGDDAVALLDDVLERTPDAPWALSLKAGVLDAERRAEEALVVHEALIARAPQAAVPWLNYGHTLKTVGRPADAIAAYRRALALDPDNGFAWHGLASLRTYRFGLDDVMAMERALSRARGGLGTVQLHFAMGKAYADQDRFEASFRHYAKANDLRSGLVPYDADATSDLVRAIRAVFTPGRLARAATPVRGAPAPIFIVGMPRSGSTLIEQILASHPLVEALGERHELNEIAAGLGDTSPAGWASLVGTLGADELRELGDRYLESVRRYRHSDRPFFTDKMPANWQYAGLIRFILPQAKIIDVRRHRLACCFSAFTTYFNSRTPMPANLADLARYYDDYVDAVDHVDMASPGFIHKVCYEDLIDDVEGEVRHLLARLDLPFDSGCLRFHENPRAVYTPSAQQVRQPINRDGLERWRSYEIWLDPLKNAQA
ncbi:tetratricopeptide (TPR) repeat protein [Sphingopyxis sp. JAI108]|nr:tetratricopeptide (TPR) repeat protein [Sphingopyxis sp. JAI108]